jgi:hypothetical protein
MRRLAQHPGVAAADGVGHERQDEFGTGFGQRVQVANLGVDGGEVALVGFKFEV